jgi:hypothetical protein
MHDRPHIEFSAIDADADPRIWCNKVSECDPFGRVDSELPVQPLALLGKRQLQKGVAALPPHHGNHRLAIIQNTCTILI